jgi:hypothetical protein
VKFAIVNGYYKLYPTTEELLFFFEKYGIMLLPEKYYFTFPRLYALKRWSVVGFPYTLIPIPAVAIKTFAGEPEDIFLANMFTYDVIGDRVCNKLEMAALSYQQPSDIKDVSFCVPGLPQAYSAPSLRGSYYGNYNIGTNLSTVYY